MKRITLLMAALVAFCMVKAEPRIVIDKPTNTLYVIEEADTLLQAGVCLGRNKGQKTRPGDHKTPEGVFSISQIQNSSSWKRARKSNGSGVYGPWFFRLKTPMTSHVGIHGTCWPNSIGKRESQGCIRMNNEDVLKLKELAFVGMEVEILPDIITVADKSTSSVSAYKKKSKSKKKRRRRR